MASLLLRRSGIAVGIVAEVLKWRADVIYQVGVGGFHQEVDVLKKEWPGVVFVGFEPCPAIYKGIKASYPGTLYPWAISDREGHAPLHIKSKHKDGSTLATMRDCKVTLVPLATLNTIPIDKSVRNLLWLDCEGSELVALRGASQFIQAVDVVNVEMTGKPVAEVGWCKPIEVHQLLVEYGFRRQWLHTCRLMIGQYDAIYVRQKMFRPEYCCDPWEEN